MTQIQWTGLHDRNGRPIAVGDLIRVYHFRAANRRRIVYMYKKVLLRNGKPFGYDVTELGQITVDDCHSYPIYPDDAVQSEIIDGPCDRTERGEIVCWWERPKVTQEATP